MAQVADSATWMVEAARVVGIPAMLVIYLLWERWRREEARDKRNAEAAQAQREKDHERDRVIQEKDKFIQETLLTLVEKVSRVIENK